MSAVGEGRVAAPCSGPERACMLRGAPNELRLLHTAWYLHPLHGATHTLPTESGIHEAVWDTVAFAANALVFFWSGISSVNFVAR